LPLGLPDSLTRSPLRRLAPFVWLASLRSLASVRRTEDSAKYTVPTKTDCHAQVAAVYSPVDTIGAREMWQPCGNQKARAVNGIRRCMTRRAAVRLLLEGRHA
jgi:hypothetical protein